jgi:hypothetical protein
MNCEGPSLYHRGLLLDLILCWLSPIQMFTFCFSGIHPTYIPGFEVISSHLAIHSKYFRNCCILQCPTHHPLFNNAKTLGRSRHCAVFSVLLLLLSCIRIFTSAFALKHTQYLYLPQNGRDEDSYRRTGKRKLFLCFNIYILNRR